MQIHFAAETVGVKRIVFQLPVVVFDGATLTLDGTAATEDVDAPQPLRKELAVTGTPRGGGFTVTVDGAGTCAVRYPIGPMRSYRGLDRRERYRPLFRVALVSMQFDDTDFDARCHATFTLTAAP